MIVELVILLDESNTIVFNLVVRIISYREHLEVSTPIFHIFAFILNHSKGSTILDIFDDVEKVIILFAFGNTRLAPINGRGLARRRRLPLYCDFNDWSTCASVLRRASLMLLCFLDVPLGRQADLDDERLGGMVLCY